MNSKIIIDEPPKLNLPSPKLVSITQKYSGQREIVLAIREYFGVCIYSNQPTNIGRYYNCSDIYKDGEVFLGRIQLSSSRELWYDANKRIAIMEVEKGMLNSLVIYSENKEYPFGSTIKDASTFDFKELREDLGEEVTFQQNKDCLDIYLSRDVSITLTSIRYPVAVN